MPSMDDNQLESQCLFNLQSAQASVTARACKAYLPSLHGLQCLQLPRLIVHLWPEDEAKQVCESLRSYRGACMSGLHGFSTFVPSISADSLYWI